MAVLLAGALLLPVVACSGPIGGDDGPVGAGESIPAGTEPGPGEGPDARTGSGPDAAPDTPPLPASLTDQLPRWSACGPPDVLQGGGPAPSPPPDGTAWECARLTVPVDWTDPTGETIGLALIRIGALPDDSTPRVGSLVFNFGGPGGSAVASLPGFEHRFTGLRAGFDLVGMDPRGVGASAGVVCLDDTAVDRNLREVGFPRDAAGEEEWLRAREEYAAGCAERAGGLLPHLTTANTARDLDLLRHVLGDSGLHYYGASYGSKLGAVYAGLFPERVGRMVLDSVVDPGRSVVERSLGQTEGFQRALEVFLADCAGRADCPTGTHPGEGARVVGDLLEGLADRPLPTADGRPLTQRLALHGVIGSLYSDTGRTRLRAALGRALAGDGTGLLEAADRYLGRDGEGRYRNLHAANTAVNCADFASRPGPAEVRRYRAEFLAASPVLGPYLVWDLTACHGWPVVSERDQPEVHAPGARPILLVGTTGDPATPYEGAERMREALGDGTGILLTLEGEGHGAYTGGDPCVVTAVDAHLLSGATPPDGTVCERTRWPPDPGPGGEESTYRRERP
ncbi:alpha/beta hydrolase [Streptomyces sp. ST2-7A]|uniref:alpha/beta hydrolase n=1 Tax=Streptomyces sp. ST2-7A TaxID=2907214 RepID=UPI001F2E14D6|nr:alpha/beta hydrolase [Streptomyces sp. ST2-7A]MCE7082494.1 alpha/beta hydrolase [Streptomyces sp. ST2-7A]